MRVHVRGWIRGRTVCGRALGKLPTIEADQADGRPNLCEKCRQGLWFVAMQDRARAAPKPGLQLRFEFETEVN